MALFTSQDEVELVVRRSSLDDFDLILQELKDGGTVGVGSGYDDERKGWTGSPGALFPLDWEAITAAEFEKIYRARSVEHYHDALVALQHGAQLQVV